MFSTAYAVSKVFQSSTAEASTLSERSYKCIFSMDCQGISIWMSLSGRGSHPPPCGGGAASMTSPRRLGTIWYVPKESAAETAAEPCAPWPTERTIDPQGPALEATRSAHWCRRQLASRGPAERVVVRHHLLVGGGGKCRRVVVRHYYRTSNTPRRRAKPCPPGLGDGGMRREETA